MIEYFEYHGITVIYIVSYAQLDIWQVLPGWYYPDSITGLQSSDKKVRKKVSSEVFISLPNASKHKVENTKIFIC